MVHVNVVDCNVDKVYSSTFGQPLCVDCTTKGQGSGAPVLDPAAENGDQKSPSATPTMTERLESAMRTLSKVGLYARIRPLRLRKKQKQDTGNDMSWLRDFVGQSFPPTPTKYVCPGVTNADGSAISPPFDIKVSKEKGQFTHNKDRFEIPVGRNVFSTTALAKGHDIGGQTPMSVHLTSCPVLKEPGLPFWACTVSLLHANDFENPIAELEGDGVDGLIDPRSVLPYGASADGLPHTPSTAFEINTEELIKGLQTCRSGSSSGFSFMYVPGFYYRTCVAVDANVELFGGSYRWTSKQWAMVNTEQKDWSMLYESISEDPDRFRLLVTQQVDVLNKLIAERCTCRSSLSPTTLTRTVPEWAEIYKPVCLLSSGIWLLLEPKYYAHVFGDEDSYGLTSDSLSLLSQFSLDQVMTRIRAAATHTFEPPFPFMKEGLNAIYSFHAIYSQISKTWCRRGDTLVTTQKTRKVRRLIHSFLAMDVRGILECYACVASHTDAGHVIIVPLSTCVHVTATGGGSNVREKYLQGHLCLEKYMERKIRKGSFPPYKPNFPRDGLHVDLTSAAADDDDDDGTSSPPPLDPPARKRSRKRQKTDPASETSLPPTSSVKMVQPVNTFRQLMHGFCTAEYRSKSSNETTNVNAVWQSVKAYFMATVNLYNSFTHFQRYL